MDFDHAIRKLERDHSSLRQTAMSKAAEKERMKREAQKRKMFLEKQLALEAKRTQKLRYVQNGYQECEMSLLDSSSKRWCLEPTSIHGDGDKISLPESLLQEIVLTDTNSSNNGNKLSFGGNDPLTFRIGILNPNYEPNNHFPMSQRMRTLMENYRLDEEADTMAMDDPNNTTPLDETEEDNKREAYLEELQHKYLAYTHCTVVEFTQEEGKVGLPQAIATALLTGQKITLPDEQEQREDTKAYIVPSTRTVQPPPAVTEKTATNTNCRFHKGQYVVYTKDQTIVKVTKVYFDDELVPYYDVQTLDGSKEVQTTEDYLAVFRNTSNDSNIESNEETTTAGHLAYGAFDIPNMMVELTVLRPKSIPKGTGCTLVPFSDKADGFSRLPDIKAALEQSLVRTRATLSINDVVYCWYRGTKFELRVQNVSPRTWGVVSCINTDLEVDIGYSDPIKSAAPAVPTATEDPITANLTSQSTTTQEDTFVYSELPPEPNTGDSNVCTIMIRAGAAGNKSGQQQQRRFDALTSTLKDVYVFAAQVCQLSESEMQSSFQLVTRLPRKVYHSSSSSCVSLADAGIKSGQHLFLVERRS
mmetsp:Transcript_27777/g.39746  ORF Transcript_27777/g.39746 Transcript_27777/m.39746 type:complete len:587 (-) Transcript_27777:159-1919(-)|eukprot:CAMPEP_0172420106 /NCGR_PEP_ID=MMETSP1064-20121228/6510_1 /TAXON_ID=202472 /ORGANISM="Aulacoseira subarctica , Strain CCAP 1002/5" /LENGTH=586 /DNA_ID=CAMNT_0013159921 /DNA_START=58 /DNA_END=1818 /DNA_ORIENTATION=+